MSTSSRLGKGLDALIPKEFDTNVLRESERIHSIAISDISPNPKQPRKTFDESSLKELTQSIKQHGVVQPLVVTKDGNRYQLVAGERRLRAAKKAGLTEVPAVVRSLKELEQLEISIIENVQRVDLSPLEQALSIERLHEQFSLSYAEIAAKLGKAVPTIHNIVRLLQLPEGGKEALQNNQISEGHARALLALKDMPDKQQELLVLIIDQKWSVRQAEQFVVMAKGNSKRLNQDTKVNKETAITKRLAEKLDTSVTLKPTKKGGSVQISYSSDKELDRILKSLLG